MDSNCKDFFNAPEVKQILYGLYDKDGNLQDINVNVHGINLKSDIVR